MTSDLEKKEKPGGSGMPPPNDAPPAVGTDGPGGVGGGINGEKRMAMKLRGLRWRYWALAGMGIVLLVPLVGRGCSKGSSGKQKAVKVPDRTSSKGAREGEASPLDGEMRDPWKRGDAAPAEDAKRRPLSEVGPIREETETLEIKGEEVVELLRRLAKAADEKGAVHEGKQDAPPPKVLPGRERAVDVPAGSSTQIKVRPSGVEEAYQTAVMFSEEEGIESTVTSFREQDISLLTKDNALLVKLRNPRANGDVLVVGKSGVMYRILVGPGSPEDYDAIVTVRARAARDSGGGAPNLAVALAGAMYQRSNPAGTTVYDGGRQVEYDRGGLKLTVRWVYETATLLGYVMEAENSRETPLLIEKERFASPGLILVGSEATRLDPGQKTSVYFVFQRGSDDQ